MNEAKLRLIHLNHCRGVGWHTIKNILNYDPSLKGLYALTAHQLQEQFAIPIERAQLIYSDLHKKDPHKIYQTMVNYEIYPITKFDELYPSLLHHTFDPPWILYCKGDLPLLSANSTIAVVGTRSPSPNGMNSLCKLLPALVQNNWTVVSGLAEGIDTKAHQLTIINGGRTIAVLGSGLLHIYPPSNLSLAKEMMKNQLVISEYPIHQRPRRWQFPERNRIISGLSRAVLVIEAKEKSGALITADQGLEQGREIFAVPGSILEERANGTNRLIQQGAKLVLQAEDILCEFE